METSNLRMLCKSAFFILWKGWTARRVIAVSLRCVAAGRFTLFENGTNIKLSDIGGGRSFGCLVFEIITEQPLFYVLDSKYQDGDPITRVFSRLGAPPDEYHEA
ncbi:kinase-like domain [Cordyceps militaris]|uniref:Kinase-like domain n=1 Tax=Cordyceps militaris TaxID=73501 RepID=A0A2H4SHJ4_CORMI|nr:kinase-like domain [Cordyceps militaris]